MGPRRAFGRHVSSRGLLLVRRHLVVDVDIRGEEGDSLTLETKHRPPRSALRVRSSFARGEPAGSNDAVAGGFCRQSHDWPRALLAGSFEGFRAPPCSSSRAPRTPHAPEHATMSDLDWGASPRRPSRPLPRARDARARASRSRSDAPRGRRLLRRRTDARSAFSRRASRRATRSSSRADVPRRLPTRARVAAPPPLHLDDDAQTTKSSRSPTSRRRRRRRRRSRPIRDSRTRTWRRTSPRRWRRSPR